MIVSTPRTLFVVVTIAVSAQVLQGCIPLVAGAAVGTGVLIAEDRRSSGTYLDDQGIELKAGNRVSEKFSRDIVHLNVTSFNKVVLLTGEAPDDKTKAEIAKIVSDVPGVRIVQNELVVAPYANAGSRANDTYVTSKVKTRFVEARRFQANHVKVVTEAGTVFLMGLVSKQEASDAAAIAATTSGVNKVVQVFEYLK